MSVRSGFRGSRRNAERGFRQSNNLYSEERSTVTMTKMRRRQFTRTLAGLASVGLAGTNSTATQVEPKADGPTHDGSITDVPGIKVGHYTDSRRPTGCTAILFENQATAGVDYDGSSVGSHE